MLTPVGVAPSRSERKNKMHQFKLRFPGWICFVFCLAALFQANLNAAPILFGGLGGHSNGDSTNDGSLATVDPTTGAVSIIGHPAGVARISGLAFDPFGSLFATTQPGGGFPPPPGPIGASQLLQLNPANGSILVSVPIMLGTTAISIADLAVQPSTGILFGIRGPNDQLGGQGGLYTINKTTGAATLVGDTGHFFGSIAFAPNGTLYMSSADLDFVTGNLINISLRTLNPANAAALTTVPTIDFFGALGIQPTDGVIFGGNGDFSQLFKINAVTGAESLIGNTGRNFVGDLAFQPVPEPTTSALIGLGLVALISWRLARRPLNNGRAFLSIEPDLRNSSLRNIAWIAQTVGISPSDALHKEGAGC
jgi:PEP-CTERM motif